MSTTDLVNDVQTRTSQCMKVQGFDYVAQTAKVDEATSIPTWQTSLVLARSWGYQLPPEAGSVDRAAITHNEAAATTAFRAALNGEHPWQAESADGLSLPPAEATGCLAEATRSTLQDLPMVNTQVRDTVRSDFERIDSSQEMTSASRDWSTCMKAAGQTFETPAAAQSAVAASSRDEQSRVATADITCALRTTYPTQYRLEMGAATQLVQQFPQWSNLLTPLVAEPAPSSNP